MDREITFTLTKHEYLQYLRQRVYWLKQYRGYKFWIRTSIPSLLVCSTLYFRWYQQLWISSLAIIVALVWIILGAGVVWKIFVHHRISEQVLENMNIKGFQQVTIRFLSDKIICEDNKAATILYTQIQTCKPLKEMFVLQYQNDKVMLLPYRIFHDDIQIKQFLCEFDKVWIQARKKAKAI